MSSYLTTATASSTYQTISGMSSYLTTATASSTYQTIANMVNYALLASPNFTGTPTAPTASAGTNTTQLATTAYVLANSTPSILPTSNTFTGTTNQFNNTLYSNGSLNVNGLDTSNEILGFNNFKYTAVGSNSTYH
jgi:predicted NACHT family NTPase